MNVLIYLLPMALGLGLAALFAFLWALKRGQYDDLDGAALRVLSDDDLVSAEQSPRSSYLQSAPSPGTRRDRHRLEH